MEQKREIYQALRQRAESSLKTKDLGTHAEYNARDAELIHELEVHQIELEMQNQELLEAQRQAQALSKKYSALFDHAPMGYFTLTRGATIIDLNLMGARLLGQDRDWLRGKNLELFIGEKASESFALFLEKVFQTRTEQTYELALNSKERDIQYFFLKGVVAEDQHGCLLTAVDITRSKQAEKALKENEIRLLELNATKDKFFSIISHDLKNPFTSIIGLSNMLRNKVKDERLADVESYAGYIHESAYRALNLLDNLLKWSGTQTGKINFNPGETDLKALVQETIELFEDSALQKNIGITLQMPQQVPAWADETMVGTILRNLLSNAIKFTHPGGKITVSSQLLPGELLLSVRDTGIGISKESQKKLFQIEEGYSTPGTHDERGTGLGLLLAREFALMHGGNIWVESKPDRGSTFFFTLPEKD